MSAVTHETANNRELPPIVNNPGLPRTAFKMATGTGKAATIFSLICCIGSPLCGHCVGTSNVLPMWAGVAERQGVSTKVPKK